jgi:predicted RNA methylase
LSSHVFPSPSIKNREWLEYIDGLSSKVRGKLLRKRWYLFDGRIAGDMWLTIESGFSITPHEKAIINAKKMMETTRALREKKRCVTRLLSVTDGTSNVGGDTMALMKFFDGVVAIEMDKTTFNFLEHNLSVAAKDHSNVVTSLSTFHGSVVEAVLKKRIKTDALFLDPPWGGVIYKNQRRVNLQLGEYSVSSITHQALKLNQELLVVFIKTPYNFDSSELKRMVKENGFILNMWKISRDNRKSPNPLFVMWAVQRYSLSLSTQDTIQRQPLIQH